MNHARILTIVVAGCLLILLLVNTAAIAYAANQAGNLKEDLKASCERGNAIRVRLNELIQDHPHTPAVAVLPPVDCEAAIG